jgi:ADP-ribose pyrophosphatase YjhB (NUDIX family)
MNYKSEIDGKTVVIDFEQHTIEIDGKKNYILGFPVAFHTVDIGSIRIKDDRIQVALIQKKKEMESDAMVDVVEPNWQRTLKGKKVPLKNCWRFPGGFVDPNDQSAEDAALRELHEETRIVSDGEAIYIGSFQVNDPRYVDSDHKIITSFYLTKYKEGGDDEKAYDDAARKQWFNLEDLNDDMQNPIHAQLFAALKERYKAYIATVNIYDHIKEEAKKAHEDMKTGVNELKDRIDQAVEHFKSSAPEIQQDLGKVMNKFWEKTSEGIDLIFGKGKK